MLNGNVVVVTGAADFGASAVVVATAVFWAAVVWAGGVVVV